MRMCGWMYRLTWPFAIYMCPDEPDSYEASPVYFIKPFILSFLLLYVLVILPVHTNFQVKMHTNIGRYI